MLKFILLTYFDIWEMLFSGRKSSLWKIKSERSLYQYVLIGLIQISTSKLESSSSSVTLLLISCNNNFLWCGTEFRVVEWKKFLFSTRNLYFNLVFSISSNAREGHGTWEGNTKEKQNQYRTRHTLVGNHGCMNVVESVISYIKTSFSTLLSRSSLLDESLGTLLYNGVLLSFSFNLLIYASFTFHRSVETIGGD